MESVCQVCKLRPSYFKCRTCYQNKNQFIYQFYCQECYQMFHQNTQNHFKTYLVFKEDGNEYKKNDMADYWQLQNNNEQKKEMSTIESRNNNNYAEQFNNNEGNNNDNYLKSSIQQEIDQNKENVISNDDLFDELNLQKKSSLGYDSQMIKQEINNQIKPLEYSLQQMNQELEAQKRFSISIVNTDSKNISSELVMPFIIRQHRKINFDKQRKKIMKEANKQLQHSQNMKQKSKRISFVECEDFEKKKSELDNQRKKGDVLRQIGTVIESFNEERRLIIQENEQLNYQLRMSQNQ